MGPGTAVFSLGSGDLQTVQSTDSSLCHWESHMLQLDRELFLIPLLLSGFSSTIETRVRCWKGHRGRGVE